MLWRGSPWSRPAPSPPLCTDLAPCLKEQLVDVTGPEYAYIPEAYGTVNTSAKVTKHVARVRVGQAQAGLKWNENCLVSLQYLQCVAMPLLAYNLCTLVVLPCILALLCFNVSITLLYCNVH